MTTRELSMKDSISLMRRHRELNNELQDLYRIFEGHYGSKDLSAAIEELNRKIWALQRDVFNILSERSHIDTHTRG